MTAAARRPTGPGRSAGKNDKFRRRLRSVDVDTFIVRGPVPVLASGVAGPPELRRPAWVIVASYDRNAAVITDRNISGMFLFNNSCGERKNNWKIYSNSLSPPKDVIQIHYYYYFY